MGDTLNEGHPGQKEKKRSQSDRENLSEEEITKLLADGILISCKPLPKDANIFHSKCYKVFNLLYDKANHLKRIKNWYQCGRCDQLMKIDLSKGNWQMTRHNCYLYYLEEEAKTDQRTPNTSESGDAKKTINDKTKLEQTDEILLENNNESKKEANENEAHNINNASIESREKSDVIDLHDKPPIENAMLDPKNNIHAGDGASVESLNESDKSNHNSKKIKPYIRRKTKDNNKSIICESDIASLSIFFSKLTHFGFNHGPLSVEHIKRLMPSQFNEESWLRFSEAALRPWVKYPFCRRGFDPVTKQPIDPDLLPHIEYIPPPYTYIISKKESDPNEHDVELTKMEIKNIPEIVKKDVIIEENPKRSNKRNAELPIEEDEEKIVPKSERSGKRRRRRFGKN